MSSLISPPMSADTKIYLPRNSLRRRYHRHPRDEVPHHPRVILGDETAGRSSYLRKPARSATDSPLAVTSTRAPRCQPSPAAEVTSPTRDSPKRQRRASYGSEVAGSNPASATKVEALFRTGKGPLSCRLLTAARPAVPHHLHLGDCCGGHHAREMVIPRLAHRTRLLPPSITNSDPVM
jgi:hypothetical protein